MEPGDILGHEPMGRVVDVGADVDHIEVGDRVVVPFNISCGSCCMCDRPLFAQCETTQVREHGKGASLFGYTKLYGHVPGGQAELLRVPQAQFGPVKVPDGPPDERFLFLSDVLPTAWQAVAYADVPEGGTLAVIGLGPIGQMACRIARHHGVEHVYGVDLVASGWRWPAPWREVVDLRRRRRRRRCGRSPAAEAPTVSSTPSAWRRTALRWPAPCSATAGLLPGGQRAAGEEGRHRPAHRAAHRHRRRAPRRHPFGRRRVRRRRRPAAHARPVRQGRTDPHGPGAREAVGAGDPAAPREGRGPLGLDDFVTHRMPLGRGPAAYAMFQAKQDGAINTSPHRPPEPTRPKPRAKKEGPSRVPRGRAHTPETQNPPKKKKKTPKPHGGAAPGPKGRGEHPPGGGGGAAAITGGGPPAHHQQQHHHPPPQRETMVGPWWGAPGRCPP